MGNEVCVKDQEFCCGDQVSENKYRKKSFEGRSHKNSLYINSSKISDDYIILHPAIGKGSFGCVYKALSRSTNITRAVKRVLKRGKTTFEL